MVRHKTRWMLIRIEHDEEKTQGKILSRKEVWNIMKENLIDCFGIVMEGVASNVKGTQMCDQYTAFIKKRSCVEVHEVLYSMQLTRFSLVRFYDDNSKLLLVRSPREDFPTVRASINFLTVWEKLRVNFRILSVHGSSRTAKRECIRSLRSCYAHSSKKKQKELNIMLEAIHQID